MKTESGGALLPYRDSMCLARFVQCDFLRIKYMKETAQLVKVMGTPANIPARQWTHGFTSCPTEWLENYKMLRWLRWAGLERDEQTIVQDFCMPGGARQ